jgi:hypothetical protein
VCCRERRERDADRMSGAQLLILDNGVDPWRDLIEMRKDVIATVTDHNHDVRGIDGSCRLEDMTDERPARDRMQNLGRG